MIPRSHPKHRVRAASQQLGPLASLAPSARGGFFMRLQESCSGKDCGAKTELTGNSSWSIGDVYAVAERESMQADKALLPTLPLPGSLSAPRILRALTVFSRRRFLSLPPWPVSLQTPPGAPAASRASPRAAGISSCPFGSPATGSPLPS